MKKLLFLSLAVMSMWFTAYAEEAKGIEKVKEPLLNPKKPKTVLPAKKAECVEAAEAAEPAKRALPAESAKPAEPAKPAEAATPVLAAEKALPAKAAKPALAAEKALPAETAKASVPAKPAPGTCPPVQAKETASRKPVSK